MIGQLSLTPTTSIPLHAALQQVAHQWSQRLGHPVRVVDDGWRGYRIEAR